MPPDEIRKPPAPVIGAVAFYALLAVAFLTFGIVMIALSGWPLGLLGAFVALLGGSIALGLWQGNSGARAMAILFGFVTLALGVVMILLLVVPQSSRAWFARDS